MTKRMKETGRYYLGLYRRSNATKLEDVYKKCSKEKSSSFWQITYEMRRLGGEGIKVLTHNSYMYTCAYMLGNTFVVHTSTNRYIFDLAELQNG